MPSVLFVEKTNFHWTFQREQKNTQTYSIFSLKRRAIYKYNNSDKYTNTRCFFRLLFFFIILVYNGVLCIGFWDRDIYIIHSLIHTQTIIVHTHTCTKYNISNVLRACDKGPCIFFNMLLNQMAIQRTKKKVQATCRYTEKTHTHTYSLLYEK